MTRLRCVQSGRTAILFAAQNGNLPIVKALVERGAKTDAVDRVRCCAAPADTSGKLLR
jgi:ankyrin repeat protein